jgi:hypothetical protein
MGFSYHPDFNSQFYRKVQADSFGRYMDYSLFEGSIPGTFGNSQSGAITFGVDNILQMKVRNKKDTGEAAIKKISLLDVFSINGAYDLLRDSFPLSNLSLTASTHLFDKINITASGFLDPYDTDTLGYPSKNLIWKRKPISLGRLSSFSVSMTTSFKGGSKGKEAEKKDPATTVRQYDPNTGMPLDEYQQELAYIQNNPAEFADFSIPWSVNLSYSLNYNNTRNAGYGGFIKTLSQSTNISGDLNLTPKWKIGLSGSYNISLKELGVLSMYLSREMHCWQMAINIAPVGHYRFFSINISPKSALLRDLKVNRTRSFFD